MWTKTVYTDVTKYIAWIDSELNSNLEPIHHALTSHENSLTDGEKAGIGTGTAAFVLMVAVVLIAVVTKRVVNRRSNRNQRPVSPPIAVGGTGVVGGSDIELGTGVVSDSDVALGTGVVSDSDVALGKGVGGNSDDGTKCGCNIDVGTDVSTDSEEDSEGMALMSVEMDRSTVNS